MFNLEKALADFNYARNVTFAGNKSYDDYIFVLSAIIAGNVPVEEWVQQIKKDSQLLNLLIYLAKVEHCLPWEQAVQDIYEFAKIQLLDKNNIQPMTNAWNFVKNNFSSTLLKILYKKQDIDSNDIIKILSN